MRLSHGICVLCERALFQVCARKVLLGRGRGEQLLKKLRREAHGPLAFARRLARLRLLP